MLPRNAKGRVDYRREVFRVIWLTSCAADMWTASGCELFTSFLSKRVCGRLVLALEGFDPPPDVLEAMAGGRVIHYPLQSDEFLQEWLKRHAAAIPEHLGGQAVEPLCRCRGGPYDVHSRKHIMPCLGHWFNKNHSRWFRKMAALRWARNTFQDADAIIWIDADCTFTLNVEDRNARAWFFGPHACFYFKSKRPVIETGIVGYRLDDAGNKLIDCLLDRYWTGRYRADSRWDDSYQTQQALAETRVKAVDIARAVGAHAAVVENSPVGPYIRHRKGRHSRELGLMS